MSPECWPCKRGEHLACIGIVTDFAQCPCDHTSQIVQPLSEIGASALSENDVEAANTFSRKLKNDDAVTDQLSTGRKRAAKLYPKKNSDGSPIPCDWANKVDVLPSIFNIRLDGCGIRKGTAPGITQALHHVNWNTLDNSPENILRLCHSCHNFAHSRIDPHKDEIYERMYGFKPSKEDLSHAAKVLRSGVVSGGQISKPKE